jgi:hypothetical protein
MSGYEAMIEEVRFAADSPLEGDGFELPVPRKRDSISSLYSARETEDREFAGSPVAESVSFFRPAAEEKFEPRLHDPALPQPVNYAVVEASDEGFILVWSPRAARPSKDRPGRHRLRPPKQQMSQCILQIRHGDRCRAADPSRYREDG